VDVVIHTVPDKVKGLLRKSQTANYQDVVQNLLISYKAMECNMGRKIHFLESHLDLQDMLLMKQGM
jgi:hypothetical protein